MFETPDVNCICKNIWVNTGWVQLHYFPCTRSTMSQAVEKKVRSRIRTRAAGWEARTPSLRYAAPISEIIWNMALRPIFFDQKLSHKLLPLMPMDATKSFDPNLWQPEKICSKNVKRHFLETFWIFGMFLFDTWDTIMDILELRSYSRT